MSKARLPSCLSGSWRSQFSPGGIQPLPPMFRSQSITGLGTPPLKAVMALCSVAGEWLREVGFGFEQRQQTEGPRSLVWTRAACSFLGCLLSGCCPRLAGTGGESGPTQVLAPGLRSEVRAGGAEGSTGNRRDRGHAYCCHIQAPRVTGPPLLWLTASLGQEPRPSEVSGTPCSLSSS